MKLSLNIKLFITISLLIIIIVLAVILLNSTVLEIYYQNQKEQSLVSIYNQAVEYYDKNTFDSTSDYMFELQKIDSTKNIEILLCDVENNVLFSSSNNFIKNGFFIPGGLDNNKANFDLEHAWTTLSDEKPYFIHTFHDRRLNSDFATLYGKTSSDNMIVLRTPIESIKESVSISNQFLVIIGIVCIFISSIITYFLSKAFSNPIMELNDIAEKMSNLDFSKKYNVQTNDEIGTLGNSINKLSESLEKTIQDLKDANIELEKDVEETSKIAEMRNQFISDVSHELKTPIALIQGYAEGLNDGIAQDEESRKYYVDVILDEANKMANLTKDLLDLSRLEYGNEKLNKEDFNINDLAKETLKKNEVLFKENGINCIFESKDDYIVNADLNRIEQVFTNYISNAIKHVNDENIIKCTINESNNGKIRVTIFNSGKNIAEEDIPRLWTRFYKVDSSRNRELGGTGIGLSLVKAIMNQHKNDCGAQNVDNGVEFWFELDKV